MWLIFYYFSVCSLARESWIMGAPVSQKLVEQRTMYFFCDEHISEINIKLEKTTMRMAILYSKMNAIINIDSSSKVQITQPYIRNPKRAPSLFKNISTLNMHLFIRSFIQMVAINYICLQWTGHLVFNNNLSSSHNFWNKIKRNM